MKSLVDCRSIASQQASDRAYVGSWRPKPGILCTARWHASTTRRHADSRKCRTRCPFTGTNSITTSRIFAQTKLLALDMSLFMAYNSCFPSQITVVLQNCYHGPLMHGTGSSQLIRLFLGFKRWSQASDHINYHSQSGHWRTNLPAWEINLNACK